HTYIPLLFYTFSTTATATTEIYTLSLHDALPISTADRTLVLRALRSLRAPGTQLGRIGANPPRHSPGNTFCRLSDTLARCECLRSEEHTSELQSQSNLVCRLLLEKKKKINTNRS